ncbi:hypothetical protein DWU98_11390 [Dyella monticola]|uniref:Uncharacterized protein n=1 Tax=Dyella monticola TaxID=1927958 RepID=A0A370WYC8_9GAMM|nr:hypothetical protein [Dyella monticola]RDS81139.1 hypothetical protein DWU98_11390 [Dyella monticola]
MSTLLTAQTHVMGGTAKDRSRDLPDASLLARSLGGYPWAASTQAWLDAGLSQAGGSLNQGSAASTLYPLAQSEYGGPSSATP